MKPRLAFRALGVDHGDGSLGLSCKLPQSSEAAVTMFSFAAPTGYGLGRSGWVSARFDEGDDVPVDLLAQWLEESYRAVAPKRAGASRRAAAKRFRRRRARPSSSAT